MSVKVITDTISDISADVAEIYDIDILPIDYLIDDTYISASDLGLDYMVKWIRENKVTPTIKGISTETYVKTFERYVKKGMEIVCITAGSGIVSNYDTACHASTRFPEANIHVIDSRQISTSIGLMAIEAADMAKQGESANAIAIRFERTSDKIKQFGLADSVEFLQYSGYCPKIVAFGSSLLKAKFEFSVYENQNFDVKMAGNSMAKALNSYFSDVFKNVKNIDSKRIFMVYTFSDEEFFADLYKRVVALDYFEDIIVCGASLHTNSLYGSNGISIAYKLK